MAILGVHVVVDLSILVLASTLVCRVLFGLLSPRAAFFGVGIVIALEVAASFLPIYLLGASPTNVDRLTLWRLWRQMFFPI